MKNVSISCNTFSLFTIGIIKQCTHPHLLPPTPTHPKYFPTHPHLLKIMLHPPPLTLTHPKHIPTNPHPPKIMSHTPPPTPTYPKYFPTHSHLPKIMHQPLPPTQKVPYLTPLTKNMVQQPSFILLFKAPDLSSDMAF